MASGNAILAGILGGLGGAGQVIGGGFAQAQKDELERERLAQERDLKQQVIDAQASQFATTQKGLSTPAEQLFGYIGMPLPPGMDPKQPIPNTIADNVITHVQKQQQVAREQQMQTKTAAFLQGAQGRPGQPAQLMGQLAEGEDPEAAALIPRSANVPAIPRMEDEDLAAGLLARGNKMSDIAALMKVIREEDAFAPLSENAPGLYNKRSGATRMFPDRPGGGPPPDVPGMRTVAAVDKNGRTTYKQEPISVGTDREGLAIDRGFPSFAQAPQPVQQEINRYLEETSLRRSRAQGADAAGTKPLTEGDVKDIASATATLSAINQARGFSPQEMTAYLGVLNRPMAEAKQILAGMGIGDADARYNEFKAINGRLKAGMFLTAGKALTPMEEKVTSAFIVTGDERNVSEYLAKMNMYEAYTRAQRETQLQMARTPRSQADLEEYDTRLTANLARAGMNAPSAQPKLGEPGYTGRVTQPDMPTAPPKPGRVWIKAPDGQWGQWDARQPIPQGYMR